MDEVKSVRGAISIDELGITLMHSHVLFDGRNEAIFGALGETPILMENLGAIRRNPGISKDNLLLNDIELAINEIGEFRRMGGSTIVETSTEGIGRDPLGLRKISERTGVNIICSTGWHVAPSHPAHIKTKNIDEICSIMVGELTEGINGTGIKAGIIKLAEGGIGVPFEEEEKKVLQAAARAQNVAKVPLTVHPNTFGAYYTPMGSYLNQKLLPQTLQSFVEQYFNIIEEEGGNLKKSYLSHASNFPGIWPLKTMMSLMDRGITLCFDGMIGEIYLDGLFPGASLASERELVKTIAELVENGYEKQIIISTDSFCKIFLKKYGGYGYSHILEHIVPIFRFKGLTDNQIDYMLQENPKRLFSKH